MTDDELKDLSNSYPLTVEFKIKNDDDDGLIERVRSISQQYSATLEKESRKPKAVNEAKKRRTRTSSDGVRNLGW